VLAERSTGCADLVAVRAEVATLVDKGAGSTGVGVAGGFVPTVLDSRGAFFYLVPHTSIYSVQHINMQVRMLRTIRFNRIEPVQPKQEYVCQSSAKSARNRSRAALMAAVVVARAGSTRSVAPRPTAAL
jgi:hypothetical protein